MVRFGAGRAGRGDKEAAYEQVLAIDEDNGEAKDGLAHLRGESTAVFGDSLVEEQVTEKVFVSESAIEANDQHKSVLPAVTATSAQMEPATNAKGDESPALLLDDHLAVNEPDLELFCYRHPNRSTSLRCYKCNKPICSECTVKTPVGYLCPDCHREAEDAFFNAKTTDYLLALLVALPVSLLAGWLVVRFSGGIFMILIFVFAGGAVGGFHCSPGENVSWATGVVDISRTLLPPVLSLAFWFGLGRGCCIFLPAMQVSCLSWLVLASISLRRQVPLFIGPDSKLPII